MNEKSTNEKIPDTIRKNIILIGFMGCGKSTIGRELHKSLRYPFIDIDHEIERQEKQKITQIFKLHGESTFRTLEYNFLTNLLKENTQRTIIATGGGITTTEKNIPLLRKLGFVVWLTCSPDSILERTSRNNNRPLLQCNNPREKIVSMLTERTPKYKQCAHLTVNTSNLSINEITYGILESARYHFGINEQ